jgi:hypothetical protein
MNSIFHQDILFSLLLGQCRVAFAAVMAILMLGHKYAGSTCCILTLDTQTANFVIVIDLESGGMFRERTHFPSLITQTHKIFLSSV